MRPQVDEFGIHEAAPSSGLVVKQVFDFVQRETELLTPLDKADSANRLGREAALPSDSFIDFDDA